MINIKFLFFLLFSLLCIQANTQIIIDSKWELNDGSFVKIKIDDYGIVDFVSPDISFTSRITCTFKVVQKGVGEYNCDFLNGWKITISYRASDEIVFNEVDENNVTGITLYNQHNNFVLKRMGKNLQE